MPSRGWVVGLCALALAVAGCGDPGRSLVTDAGDVAADALPLRPDDVRAGCASDNACDDRIACTIDHCREGACTHTPCADCCAAGAQCVVGYGCGRAATPCATDAECGDGIRCTLDRCRDGRACEHLAQDGLCAGGEVCLAALGCIPRPPATCRADADCAPAACLGSWTCQTELGCQFRAPTSCDDGNACTADTCDAARGGCQHAPRDGDMDGHGTAACGGDDCDDAEATRHPGAPEVCGNGRDDDCDRMTDEGCCVAGRACTTTCGTAGATTCVTAAMAGPCAPPPEACGNGRDDDCDGTTDEGCCAAGRACATTCGSTGTTTCPPDGAPARCAPPAEACNGRDDDCDGRPDNGFACVPGAVSACTTACGSASTRACNPDCTLGPCAAPMERCNGRDDDCDGAADNGFACVAGAAGPCATACGSTGRRACLGSCAWDACVPPAETCNGADDNCNGACDEGFTCCARATRDCRALGFAGGTAVCRGDCGGWDTTGCTSCGNGRRDAGEPCDGADLGGATCASQGFGAGVLRCSTACALDTSGCSSCGNGRVDPGEPCDGAALGGQTCASLGMGFSGGALRCAAGCAFDTAMCTRPFNPTGTWVVAPGVNYYCAFGAVRVSFGNLTFTDSGSGLSVSGGGLNCTMTGASARTTRMVTVTCSLPGGCTETYRLTGTFTTDNAFSGTFTAGFTGSGCFDCRSGTFAVSGSR